MLDLLIEAMNNIWLFDDSSSTSNLESTKSISFYLSIFYLFFGLLITIFLLIIQCIDWRRRPTTEEIWVGVRKFTPLVLISVFIFIGEWVLLAIFIVFRASMTSYIHFGLMIGTLVVGWLLWLCVYATPLDFFMNSGMRSFVIFVFALIPIIENYVDPSEYYIFGICVISFSLLSLAITCILVLLEITFIPCWYARQKYI